MFFQVFQHLLPRAEAWKTTVNKTLRKFFAGLAAGVPDDARTFIDLVHGDAFPDTTRELEAWEREFGLEPNGDEATRRLALAAEWKATGGQSPSYIQGVLQTAGFSVYVHEWWSSGPPYVARDPRSYTNQPLIGTTQCSAFPSQPVCRKKGNVLFPQFQCNRFLANDTGYLVNKDLTLNAPPRVPDDPAFWPYFLYIGGQTFPNHAVVDSARRAELERLVLKLRPAQQWVVLLIDYSGTGTYTTRNGSAIYTNRSGVADYTTRI